MYTVVTLLIRHIEAMHKPVLHAACLYAMNKWKETQAMRIRKKQM
jgi:hypothetical protein